MMDPARASAISRHLEELVIAYWHDVDFNWGRNAAAHYTADGEFISKRSHYVGREQIGHFYAWRQERSERVNVHLVGNFHVARLTETQADVCWISTLYAHDGVAPQQSAPPIAISRVEDVFARVGDGPWLCQRREWHALFAGGVPTTGLSPEEMAARVARASE